MSTQNVTEKILRDAKNDVQAIIRKYQEQAQQIKNASAEKYTARRKAIETQAAEMKKTEIMRAIAQKKLTYNKQLVNHKQKLIDTVIEQALTTLHGHKEYEDFLNALIQQSNLQTGELHINNRDWKKHGSSIEKNIKKENRDYTIVKDATLSGGLTIRHETTTHHGSLDLINELLHEELTIAVSKQLL